MTTVELLRQARRLQRAADGLAEDPRNPLRKSDQWLLELDNKSASESDVRLLDNCQPLA